MIKEIKLPTQGIIITDDGNGAFCITSELHTDSMIEEDVEFNAGMDALESIVLAHYCAGIDVESPASSCAAFRLTNMTTDSVVNCEIGDFKIGDLKK